MDSTNRRSQHLGRLLTLVSALWVGCGDDPSTEGSASVSVASSALSSADVTRVGVTISGPGIATPIVRNLVKSSDRWRGTFLSILVGVATARNRRSRRRARSTSSSWPARSTPAACAVRRGSHAAGGTRPKGRRARPRGSSSARSPRARITPAACGRPTARWSVGGGTSSDKRRLRRSRDIAVRTSRAARSRRQNCTLGAIASSAR